MNFCTGVHTSATLGLIDTSEFFGYMYTFYGGSLTHCNVYDVTCTLIKMYGGIRTLHIGLLGLAIRIQKLSTQFLVFYYYFLLLKFIIEHYTMALCLFVCCCFDSKFCQLSIVLLCCLWIGRHVSFVKVLCMFC